MPPLFSESVERELGTPAPRWPLKEEDEHGQEGVKKRGREEGELLGNVSHPIQGAPEGS